MEIPSGGFDLNANTVFNKILDANTPASTNYLGGRIPSPSLDLGCTFDKIFPEPSTQGNQQKLDANAQRPKVNYTI